MRRRGSHAGLLEQLGCELARERLDLASELSFLGGQLQHAPGNRAQRKHAAAELRIPPAAGSCRSEALQQRARVSGRSSLRNGSGS